MDVIFINNQFLVRSGSLTDTLKAMCNFLFSPGTAYDGEGMSLSDILSP